MKRNIHIVFQEYQQLSGLNTVDLELLKEAVAARDSAYAAYSNFKVGAAVKMQDGSIVKGSNQENAAYPSGLCAERVALFAAVATFPDYKVESIAVYAENSYKRGDDPISPCGSCRQALIEYESKQASPIRVILSSDKGKTWVFDSICSLLPLAFGARN